MRDHGVSRAPISWATMQPGSVDGPAKRYKRGNEFAFRTVSGRYERANRIEMVGLALLSTDTRDKPPTLPPLEGRQHFAVEAAVVPVLSVRHSLEGWLVGAFFVLTVAELILWGVGVSAL